MAEVAVNEGTSRMKRLRLQRPGGRRLKVRGADLDDLPLEVFSMLDLEVLDLSPERESCLDYHLPEVPVTIGRLVNLRVLMLDTNRLYELPEELCLLTQLERLSLSNNHLKNLPRGFTSLCSLKSLHAANNQFNFLPDSVCKLPLLHFLDFSDNKLTSLPSAIGALTKLETLLLYRNLLTSLPDAVCDLQELRMLWVGENRLKRLPRKMGLLKRLDWGQSHTISSALDGNPMAHPPLHVCKEGPAAIDSYFQVTEARPVNRNRKQLQQRKMSNVTEEC